jgi:hypothetical protein
MRLLPLPLCLAVAACGSDPLSLIPPADMALLAADSRPVPGSLAAMPAIGPMPAGLDPLAVSFHAALCGGAQPAPEAAAMGCGNFPGATVAEAPQPIVAPAAISVTDMLARVRGGDPGPDADGEG